jgi:2'-5' RNA ligase
MLQQSPTVGPGKSLSTSRLFFALCPTAAVRDAIYEASRSELDAADGKPVPADNFHMTLVFLGSVSNDSLSLVKSIAASVASGRCRVELDRYGYWKQPRVLWCGASRVLPAAAMLAANLRERLAAAGFDPDPQPFVPHVTLARKVRRPGVLGAFGPVRWEADSFALMNSVTSAHGSEYSPLATYALGASGNSIMGNKGH